MPAQCRWSGAVGQPQSTSAAAFSRTAGAARRPYHLALTTPHRTLPCWAAVHTRGTAPPQARKGARHIRPPWRTARLYCSQPAPQRCCRTAAALLHELHWPHSRQRPQQAAPSVLHVHAAMCGLGGHTTPCGKPFNSSGALPVLLPAPLPVPPLLPHVRICHCEQGSAGMCAALDHTVGQALGGRLLLHPQPHQLPLVSTLVLPLLLLLLLQLLLLLLPLHTPPASSIGQWSKHWCWCL